MPPAKKEDVKLRVFQELSREITVDAVQSKDYGDKSKGYNIGYLIERLNVVLANYGWSWDVELLPMQFGDSVPQTFLVDTVEFSKKNGGTASKTSVAVHVRVSIYDDQGNVVWKKDSFGGCQLINNNIGDTIKGAQTDGMKKAFGYLGIGNEAYKDEITDQIRRFRYERTEILNFTKKVLADGLERELTTSILLKFIQSATSKDYKDTEALTHDDWLKVHKAAADFAKTNKKTKKKAADESQDRDGENSDTAA